MAVRTALAAPAAAGTPDTLDVVPPAAIQAAQVSYPPGAQGNAVVVLEVIVDEEGRVSEARVVDGEEPFASAALDAVRPSTFAPARRQGQAVAARIRIRVEFHAPAPIPTPVRPPPSTAPAARGHVAAPPGDDATPEVHVRGARVEVGQTRLGGAEVRQLPGAFGDAFRAIEALPGVTPIVSGLPFFFVRGAPPGNVGYFVDGVRVPAPLPSRPRAERRASRASSTTSTSSPAATPRVSGATRAASSTGETVPPAARAHGEANVRLFDAGALVEAPMLDGRLTALVAGRYSYTAALVQLFAKDTRVAYWDYQTRLSYEVTPRDRVSVFLFGSFDEIDNRDRQSDYDARGDYVGESLSGVLSALQDRVPPAGPPLRPRHAARAPAAGCDARGRRLAGRTRAPPSAPASSRTAWGCAARARSAPDRR